MLEEQIKSFIKSYKSLKAKKEILDKIAETASLKDDIDIEDYNKTKIKMQIIESSLEILDKSEKEVVLLHLIENNKWNEIISIYEAQKGMEGSYSDRTFKRIQQNALQKMEEFVFLNKFEKYINEK